MAAELPESNEQPLHRVATQEFQVTGNKKVNRSGWRDLSVLGRSTNSATFFIEFRPFIWERNEVYLNDQRRLPTPYRTLAVQKLNVNSRLLGVHCGPAIF